MTRQLDPERIIALLGEENAKQAVQLAILKAQVEFLTKELESKEESAED